MANIVVAIQWVVDHLVPVVGAFIALVGAGVAAAIIGIVIGSIIFAIM